MENFSFTLQWISLLLRPLTLLLSIPDVSENALFAFCNILLSFPPTLGPTTFPFHACMLPSNQGQRIPYSPQLSNPEDCQTPSVKFSSRLFVLWTVPHNLHMGFKSASLYCWYYYNGSQSREPNLKHENHVKPTEFWALFELLWWTHSHWVAKTFTD